MGFTLKIIVPEQLIFEGEVTSVTLPTLMGEIQILENHLPIVGGLETGTVLYTTNGKQHSMAIDMGFFKFKKNQLTLLTEAAIDVQAIDARSIDEAVARAQAALEKARNSKVDAEEIERLDKMFRFQLAQQLAKRAKRS